MVSLVQLRQRIIAERNRAIVFFVLGLASIMFSITSSIVQHGFSAAGLAGIGLVFVVMGLFRLRAARRDLATFEAEHGADAGKQQPIR